MPNEPRLFWCFLSYRHADNTEAGRQWATWLQHEIETYEVPADLAGTENKRGDVIPERLFPVFRDEAELPADADLTATIRTALEASKVLVVLCSPRAAASRYVQEEISYFKHLGRADRILAAILEGEPHEAFPKPLRSAEGTEAKATEPIAADFRLPGGQQGWTSPEAYRLALAKGAFELSKKEVRDRVTAYRNRLDLMKLKIIAGILAVPFGTLTQRDQAYQLQQAKRRQIVLTRWLMVIAVLAALAMAGGAIAWRQYLAAKKAKNAADGLIEFMQYELGGTMARIGRLDVVDRLNTRVSAYQELYPPETLDLTAQRDKSVALAQQARVALAQGRLSEARKLFSDAAEIQSILVRRRPEIGLWQDDLALSYIDIAEIQFAQGEQAAALETFLKAQDLLERLVERDPENLLWQRDLMTAYARTGDLLRDQGRINEAFATYEKRLAAAKRLTEKAPADDEFQRALSISYIKLGEILEAQEKQDEALQAYQAAAGITRRLASARPQDAFLQRDISVSCNNIGGILLAKGDLPGAQAAFQESRGIREKLLRQDPSNAQWQRDYAMSLQKLADVFGEQGKYGEAAGMYESSAGILEQLIAKEPGNLRWRRELASLEESAGNAKFAENDLAAALAHYRRSLELRESFAESDSPVQQLETAVSCGRIAAVLLEFPGGGDPGEAVRLLEKARAILDALPEAIPNREKVRRWIEGMVPRANG